MRLVRGEVNGAILLIRPKRPMGISLGEHALARMDAIHVQNITSDEVKVGSSSDGARRDKFES